MDLAPDDSLLEIGCGVGIHAELIASKLNSGSIMAIDRSDGMISKAVLRNEAYIKTKRVRFKETALSRFSSTRVFNKIFCFNINIFWTNKEVDREMEIIRKHLTPAGTFYIFYGPMVNDSRKIVTAVQKNLEQSHFKLCELVKDANLNCCGFITKPL
ncbi:SAM-dependent methyltransferase [Chryseosolibacter indicus]|uniref:Class I SAM-dependent methyltransferase n=1 Tax=Chryseosolibacter indicus TaxID=2782351 RepID=A0ABS5VPM8_9BACT|nr:class I SAM-dependent methyltransferase [Chryseosolibacter indicus]MBT1703397.1 class I SAM-dependent methyltransferase [Chryseosolibacter indicus]